MSKIILGVNAYHGDSAACILVDGTLVAAVEEETNRTNVRTANVVVATLDEAVAAVVLLVLVLEGCAVVLGTGFLLSTGATVVRGVLSVETRPSRTAGKVPNMF